MNLNHIKFGSEIGNDLDRIVTMTSEIFTDIPQTQILKDFRLPLSQYLVAYYKDSPVGIVAYREEMKGFKMFELFYAGILPEFRKNGLGKLLIQNALLKIKEDTGAEPTSSAFVTLIARPGDAKNFFVKTGFEVIHSIHTGTEPLVIMQKVLY